MDSFIHSFDPITKLGLPSSNSLPFSKIPPNFSKFPQNHPPPQMVVPTSNCSSRSSTPSIPPSNPFSTIRMPRKISSNTLEQYSPLTEDHRKLSLSSAIQKTKDGLGNMFGIDEQSPEELIYNLFKVPNKSDAFIGKLIMVLKNHGLQENDPRLAPMMRKIREIESEKEEKTNEARDPKHWKLSKNDFKRVISESMSLIVQTMQGDLIVPAWGQFTNIIKEIYEECIPIEIGKVADYIPQLARMIPEHWGVSICTVDGQRASFGNSNIPFCVQSVSKAFNYGIAASEMGAEFVHQYVGQEPSGRLFNEICLDSNNKPHNPMVNSGAIIVTSLIQNRLNMADRFEHMINEYRKISGGEYVGFNNAVFLSESNTADRNFALAYFMKENGCFPPETHGLKEALDFYFQLCSLEVTCEGMAVMASTLANGGVCPLTGERCIGSRPCRDVLSLMNSCGMYDYSGQFAFHVGLPAKSGVSGVMIVVIPNLMGIALWSPPLDRMGNSVRGVEFCKRLIQRFNFHNYDSMVHNECPKFDPRHRIGERERAAVVSLLFAAKAADLNTIRRMYMQQVDLEMADYDKRTALHLAASEGHFDVALFLLEIGKVKPDPRDRWNRTPLDDAREARHTSVALLLERRMQELEQAKTIPAGRPMNLASKANSLQMLPSQHGGQKGILHQSSSGTDLKEPLEIETAEMNGDGGLHRPFSMDFAEANETKRRQVPPSPLGQNSFTAISPPLGREGNGEDSGLSSSSAESTISPTNGQFQGQREIVPNGENKHSSFRDQPHQNGIVHSNGEESGMQNGIPYSGEGKANGHFWADQSHRESKEGEMEEFEMRARAYSDENNQNPTPIFHLGQNSHSLEAEYFGGEQQMMGTPEYHGRTYSNGKRYWQEEKERIDEETNSRFGKKDRLEEEEATDNSEDSDEEEEEDILAKKEEREGQMAVANGGQPQRIRTLSMQQFHRMPEYGNGNGHPRLTNHRIEQLKHYLI